MRSNVIRDLQERLEEVSSDVDPAVLVRQRHLDSGSDEQAYWHHGYCSALRDALRALTSETDTAVSLVSTH